MLEGSPFFTNPIPLSEEEIALQLYRPDKGRILFIDGYLQTRIHIKHPQKNKVSRSDLLQINILIIMSSLKLILCLSSKYNSCPLQKICFSFFPHLKWKNLGILYLYSTTYYILHETHMEAFNYK